MASRATCGVLIGICNCRTKVVSADLERAGVDGNFAEMRAIGRKIGMSGGRMVYGAGFWGQNGNDCKINRKRGMIMR